MAGNISSPSNGRTGKNIMIEDVEGDVDELPDSHFSKAAAIVFDKIDNGESGVLTSSKFSGLIETLGGGFHSEDMADRMQREDPNESVSLDRFAFVRWYMDEEVSVDSAEEAELFLGWYCKFIMLGLQ